MQSSKRRKRFSHLDKELMKLSCSPDTRTLTSKSLAKILNVPATTVQRHRKRLEDTLLRLRYDIDLKKLGWNRVYFFVGTREGKTTSVAKELSRLIEVVSVEKSIGHPTIDLHVEAFTRDITDIARIVELIGCMKEVSDVIWSMPIEDMARKSSVPPHVIDTFD